MNYLLFFKAPSYFIGLSNTYFANLNAQGKFDNLQWFTNEGKINDGSLILLQQHNRSNAVPSNKLVLVMCRI
jgi:hypothetical protein